MGFVLKDAAISSLHIYWEAINRANYVARLLDGSGESPPRIVEEVAYLQFRKICELVALMSLYLHGDLPTGKRLLGEWNAEVIMKRLGRLHPDFFPRSASVSLRHVNPAGQKVWQLNEPHDTNALSASDLKLLYVECGAKLHAGSIKSIDLSVGANADLSKTKIWHRKIVALLNGFAVHRAESRDLLIFNAKSSNDLPDCALISYVADLITIEILSANLP